MVLVTRSLREGTPQYRGLAYASGFLANSRALSIKFECLNPETETANHQIGEPEQREDRRRWPTSLIRIAKH